MDRNPAATKCSNLAVVQTNLFILKGTFRQPRMLLSKTWKASCEEGLVCMIVSIFRNKFSWDLLALLSFTVGSLCASHTSSCLPDDLQVTPRQFSLQTLVSSRPGSGTAIDMKSISTGS